MGRLRDAPPPIAVVVIGVAGAGKSTIARAVADRVGAAFVEADDLHPAENVAKMAGGAPLDDADRWPWLDRVADAIRESPGPVVVACSALRRAYRDRLRERAGRPLAFVHLDGSAELLRSRIAGRSGHFMPAALLDSQLATLEPLAADEPGVTLDVAAGVPELVAAAVGALAADGSGPISRGAPSSDPR